MESITGPMYAEFTSPQWISITKAIDKELWYFLWSAPEQAIEQTVEMSVILDAIAHHDVTVMFWFKCLSVIDIVQQYVYVLQWHIQQRSIVQNSRILTYISIVIY